MGGGGGGNGGGGDGGDGGDVSCKQMRGLQSATSIIKGLPPVHRRCPRLEPPIPTDVGIGGAGFARPPPACGGSFTTTLRSHPRTAGSCARATCRVQGHRCERERALGDVRQGGEVRGLRACVGAVERQRAPRTGCAGRGARQQRARAAEMKMRPPSWFLQTRGSSTGQAMTCAREHGAVIPSRRWAIMLASFRKCALRWGACGS